MQETMNLIASFINQVGFPIAAFMLIWWDNNQLRKCFNEEKEAHKTETENMTTAITKLTIVLQQLHDNMKG